MVIADPGSELIGLITAMGDPPPPEASRGDRRRAELIRRRFSLSLPPPFAGGPLPDEPVRPAAATDGAALAAVKWRCFGADYRGGLLPDAFLDGRSVVPPVSFWVGRAMVPPSRRHRLLVWGRPGSVYGYVDVGPVHPGDLAPEQGEDPSGIGEVYELYVDPTAQHVGGGGRLLAAAHEWLSAAGFASAELSVLAGNERAQGFYAAHGWSPTGRLVDVDLGSVSFQEVRFRRRLGPTQP